MHRRRLDQTAFGFAFVKTCVARVPDIVIEYMRIPLGDTCTRVVLNPGLSSSEPRPFVSASLSTVVAVSMCPLHSYL